MTKTVAQSWDDFYATQKIIMEKLGLKSVSIQSQVENITMGDVFSKRGRKVATVHLPNGGIPDPDTLCKVKG